MAYQDPALGRQRDRERFHRRSAERRAAGLCPRCGRQPPASGRTVCESCAGKRNRASRARDARLRAVGKPRRDLDRARAYERERAGRQTAERRVAGLCTRCGQAPAAPEHAVCEPCGEKRREAERIRYATAIATGKLYAGRDPAAKRRSARAASRKRRQARLDGGRCTRCGRRPAVEGGTVCEPCQATRQAVERQRYTERRATGLCVRCGGRTTDGGSRCAPCAVLESERGSPERRNASNRRRYAERRTAGRCTDCNRASQGAARCEPCARRSYERSDFFRGMPLYPPSFTVVDPATGEDYGTWDSWEEVAMCLAFSRLSLDRVEIVTDQSPVGAWAAWE